MDIKSHMADLQQRIDALLKSKLDSSSVSSLLLEAMHYSVLNGGKRVRPVLAYAAAKAVGGEFEQADICACAVEMIHAYSLVHDDLPAMDDDALRRGKPTCHIKYDEATAILVGDALQSLAFELLATSKELAVTDHVRIRMIALLSQAAGAKGMVAGQCIDTCASGDLMSESALQEMHRLKTGALIRASVLLGAMSTGQASQEQLDSLDEFSRHLGLVFQIKDDILDVESDTGTLGKEQGRDSELAKPTYTSMLGLEQAREKMQQTSEAGLGALSGFDVSAEFLRSIAGYVVNRSY